MFPVFRSDANTLRARWGTLDFRDVVQQKITGIAALVRGLLTLLSVYRWFSKEVAIYETSVQCSAFGSNGAEPFC